MDMYSVIYRTRYAIHV